MIHQDGEIGDVGEIDMVHRHAIGVFNENAVIRIETRKGFIAIRQWQRLLERRAVAVDGEITEDHVATTPATQNCSAVEGRGRTQDGVVAGDDEIVRAIRQPKLGRNFDCAGRQMNRAGRGKAESDEQREDQALFYLAWRLNFAARAFRRCAI